MTETENREAVLIRDWAALQITKVSFGSVKLGPRRSWESGRENDKWGGVQDQRRVDLGTQEKLQYSTLSIPPEFA